MTTSGTFYEGNAPASTYYTNAYNYDASGRLSSTDLQQCRFDTSNSSYSSTESMTTYTYDADDHMLWQANGNSSAPSSCNYFGPPFGHNDTYAVNWGTSGHPYSVTDRTDNTYLSGIATYPEYLHWDGDTLLFTSGTPSGPPDNIKVGSIAEIRPSDGAIQVFDRDTAGEIWDGHTTVANGWNDSYGRFGGTFNGPNPAFSFGAISEPRPQNLTGWGLITIQGVRGVDGSLTQWTTPDAYAGSIHDPASQKPYMYEGNNSYAYSDPSGFCTQRIGGPAEDCGQQGEDDPIIIAAGGGRPRPEDDHPGEPKVRKKGTADPLSRFERAFKHALHLDGAVNKLPKRTVGIDRTEFTRWHTQIKGRAGLTGEDNAYINKDTEDLWIQNRDGTYTNLGNVHQFYQASGKK